MPAPSQVSEAAKPYGGKLCEGVDGYDLDCITEVGYVVQGDKLWFSYGKATKHGTALVESLQDHANIVESIDQLELIEEADGKKTVKGGIWHVEGPAQRSDKLNANKRVYPRKIWERLIKDAKSPVQECIKARGMVGHLEHPKDGRTDGNLGAWVVTESKLIEGGPNDGVVWNKYELLDTPAGKILQEYTRKGVRYGSSSRGNGTVGEDGRVNENDFMVETWDAVMRPSTSGAYPVPIGTVKAESTNSVVLESQNEGEMTKDAKACYEQVRALVGTVVEGSSGVAREQLAEGLVASLTNVDKLARSGAMPSGVAYDLRSWLSTKVGEVVKVPSAVLESQVDAALASETDKGPDKRSAAFSRVIESFRKRMTDSLEEAASLRKSLKEAQEKNRALIEEVESLKRSLHESRAETGKVQARLDVATTLVAEQSSTQDEEPISDAVEEAIQEYPGLAKHRDSLEAASTMAEFNSILEGYLPEVMARPVGTSAPVCSISDPRKRRTLPCGDVVSESITARSSLVKATPGSSKAAAVVRHMTTPRV